MSEMLQHALDYARRDWPVFPCHPATKAPLTPHGFRDASTDEAAIARWWQARPDAMIGVPMGRRSGIWALDPDAPDKAGKPDGRKEWARLTAIHGAVDTRTHHTPRGGLHLLFRWETHRPVSNREGMIKGRGINVRGEGGYIVAPPSRRSDGTPYLAGHQTEIAIAPDWLYELVSAEATPRSTSERAFDSVRPRQDCKAYATAALEGECQVVANALAGTRNNTLNTAAFKLGTLLGAGTLSEGECRSRLLEAATACGLVAEDGPRAVHATITSGLRAGMQQPRDVPDREQWFSSAGNDPGGTSDASTDEQGSEHRTRSDDGCSDRRGDHPSGSASSHKICATPYAWTDPATIPVRDWVYKRLLIRKFVSATVAPGGVGKTALTIAETLSMVSGLDLLGEREALFGGRRRIWLYNLEDPAEELARRIQATAKHYDLTPEDLADRLFVNSGRDQPLVIAISARSGFLILRPVLDQLTAEIVARQIDVMIVDPFVSCHQISENDNSAIDAVTKQWAAVASDANCAIHLVHHTRKQMGDAEITVDSSRGGKALTDACRLVRVVNRMTKDEGEKAGVENHRLHFRTYDDKANLAPPADKSTWFKLHSVNLGNGPFMGAGGDDIGVVTSWAWPDPLEGMTGPDFDKVAARIRSGRWRESPQAKDWVGIAVAGALDIKLETKSDRARVLGMIRIWLASGSLIVVDGEDAKRMPRKFIEVKDEESAAEA
jgi:hypothetical protein